MKSSFITASLSLLLIGLYSCQQSEVVRSDPNPIVNVPFFNQVKTEFRGSQVNRLLGFWYKGRSRQPVDFAVINDQKAYQAFFEEPSADSLPVINFNRYTLLIGNRGSYGSSTDGPANINSIEQDLQPQTDGSWYYTVTISARSKGMEWFGFAALAPRIDKPETIKLVMQYK